MNLVSEHINEYIKHLTPKSEEEISKGFDSPRPKGEFEIWIHIKSHPRRDGKILEILNNNFRAHYAGGVGGGGIRAIFITSPETTLKEVYKALNKYFLNGTIIGMHYVNLNED